MFVVHGRTMAIRSNMVNLLRTWKSQPMEWEEIVTLTSRTAPSTLDTVQTGVQHCNAVLILLTPIDLAQLSPYFKPNSSEFDESSWSYQPRPNMLFEAGMAFALRQDRTILINFHGRRFGCA